jgi:hypothetical protein
MTNSSSGTRYEEVCLLERSLLFGIGGLAFATGARHRARGRGFDFELLLDNPYAERAARDAAVELGELKAVDQTICRAG